MKTNVKNLGKFISAIVLALAISGCSKHTAHVSVSKANPLPDSIPTALVVSAIPKFLQLDSLSFEKKICVEQVKAKQFYSNHLYQTQWLFDSQPSPLYAAFETLLSDADKYGLRAADYDLAGIQQKVKVIYSATVKDPALLATLDRHITEMLFKFTTHLSIGKITQGLGGSNIWMHAKRIDHNLDVALINQVRTPENLMWAIEQLQPLQEQYTKLQHALTYYRSLEKTTPDAIEITKLIKVKQSEHNNIIPSVRKKLSVTDQCTYAMVYDSTVGVYDSLRYDADLVSAVKSFQLKHGLEPDGIIGEKTLRFLNQSFKDKADIIALNMERLRWSRDKYGENYIHVNVPAFTMRVYENKKPALEMRVIVGAVDSPTPIFSDALEYIVFSPTWTVPTSIIKDEIIPRLKVNASYYADKNYAFYKNEVAIDPATEVWDENANPYKYRIVQQPGAANSLGLVKFVMPNEMSVYLHDTPNHRLFSKDFRALSHGCVRLSEPARFATYLLRDQKGWNQERVQKAMHATEPTTILLKKKYEVHIDYITAWVDEQDSVHFREDIYGHDKRQLQQLYPKEKMGELAGL